MSITALTQNLINTVTIELTSELLNNEYVIMKGIGMQISYPTRDEAVYRLGDHLKGVMKKKNIFSYLLLLQHVDYQEIAEKIMVKSDELIEEKYGS